MQQDPLRRALERSRFFQGVGADELHLLSATMRQRRLAPAEVLYVEGEPGDAMALLTQGCLSVRVRGAQGGDTPLQVVHPGEVIGEMSCVDPAPRSATVVALETSLVHVLDRHVLAYLRREAPSLIAALMASVISQLTTRLWNTRERLTSELQRLSDTPTPSAPAPRLASGPPPERHLGAIPMVEIPPLRGLEERDLARLASVAPARRWSDGAPLCHEGEHGSSCFLVVAGEVDVVKATRGEQRRLATLHSGSLVGQAALIDRAPRSASLRARGTVIAFELDRGTFERLLAQASPLALRFQEEIAVCGIRQLRSVDRRLSLTLADDSGAPQARSTSAPDHTRRAAPLALALAALGEWGLRVEDLEPGESAPTVRSADASERAPGGHRG